MLSRAPALSTIPSFPKPEFKLPGGIPPCQELGGVVVLGVGLTHSPATQRLQDPGLSPQPLTLGESLTLPMIRYIL